MPMAEPDPVSTYESAPSSLSTAISDGRNARRSPGSLRLLGKPKGRGRGAGGLARVWHSEGAAAGPCGPRHRDPTAVVARCPARDAVGTQPSSSPAFVPPVVVGRSGTPGGGGHGAHTTA